MTTTPRHRRILVTDGDQRASLAVVRSLGAAGHEVHVACYEPRSLAGASRFASAEHVVSSALSDPSRFADDVHDLVVREKFDTVIPMTEPALLALLPQRERFGDTLIPFPDAATFSEISDKRAVLLAAESCGIAVPEQTVIATQLDAARVDLSAIEYPVVVKPSRSVSTAAGTRIKFSVRHAASAAELATILTGMTPQAYPLLLQQRIVGAGVGIFVLLWDGELIAEFAHRRIREKPPSGGVSVYRESVAVDPALLATSLALLAEFKWHGVAMVEYKIDERSGTPFLMEINGRFWGSLQLAVDSGVDFPRLLLDAASGDNPEPVTRYKTGVRSRWFWGDVDHLISRLRHSAEHLSLPAGSPSRRSTMSQFLARNPADVSEILRQDDIRPFLRETAKWFKDIFR